jgi:hypothetical protein
VRPGAGGPLPLAAPSWPARSSGPIPSARSGSTTTTSGPGATRPAWPGPWSWTTWPGRRRASWRRPPCEGLEHLRHVEGPVIFAANHASHVDTPLLLTNLPVEFRHHTVVAAASDYFFDRTWKSVLWSFSLAAIPIERSKVNRKSGTPGRADRGRVEPGHLPRRRAVPRRLDPAIRRRRRLPGPAHRPAGRAGLPARHPARAAQDADDGRRAHPAVRAPSRAGGRLRRAPISVLFGSPLTPTRGRTPIASPTASRLPWRTLAPRGALRLVAGPALGERGRSQ